MPGNKIVFTMIEMTANLYKKLTSSLASHIFYHPLILMFLFVNYKRFQTYLLPHPLCVRIYIYIYREIHMHVCTHTFTLTPLGIGSNHVIGCDRAGGLFIIYPSMNYIPLLDNNN